MTAAAWVRPAIVKEVRGLLPIWLASAATMAAIAFLRSVPPPLPAVLKDLVALALPVAWLGPIAIGAYSTGQEYSYRTLGAFLSQPAGRRQLFLVKFGVLATLLAVWALILVPLTQLHPLPEPDVRLWFAGRPIAVPALYALCVAPYLTMVCRSALAGVVLTTAIPEVLTLSSYSIALALHRIGFSSALNGFPFLMSVIWWASVTIAAIGASATWWTVRRLEVADGDRTGLRLPTWLVAWNATGMEKPVDVAEAPRRQSRWWLLVKKELHVQRVSILVAGFYAFLTVVWLSAGEPATYVMPHKPFLIVYSCLVAVLVGSLASAGERQYGAIEWQVLLPVATRWQWSLKAAMAIGLTAALVLGLPAVFAAIEPELRVVGVGEQPLFILLTTCGLYVSSLCSNGLRAFVWSLAATLGVGAFVQSLNDDILWPLRFSFLVSNAARQLVTPSQAKEVHYALTHWPELGMLVALVPASVLALRFAQTNHASSDRGTARIWKQVVWIAVCLTIGDIMFVALNLVASSQLPR